jgi:hypothetical protein
MPTICQLQTCLKLAASGGHVLVLKFLKAWRRDLTAVAVEDSLALTSAAGNGHLSALQFMFEAWGFTVATLRKDPWISINGHVQMLQYLKDWRDSVNPADRLTLKDVRSNNNNALREAAQSGRLEVLQFLQSWVDPDGDRLTLTDVRVDNNYALIWSAARGHLHVLTFLRAWRDADGSALTKADVCTKQNMALQQAALNDRFEVCQFLAEWARALEPR